MNNTKTLHHISALLFFSAILALPAQATRKNPISDEKWHLAYDKSNINNISSKLEKIPLTVFIMMNKEVCVVYDPIKAPKAIKYEDLKRINLERKLGIKL